jgi:hypothetical protein
MLQGVLQILCFSDFLNVDFCCCNCLYFLLNLFVFFVANKSTEKIIVNKWLCCNHQ